MHVVMLFACKCGGRQFAKSPPKAGFLAPAHQTPLTAMLLFSSDVQQYMICESVSHTTEEGSSELP